MRTIVRISGSMVWCLAWAACTTAFSPDSHGADQAITVGPIVNVMRIYFGRGGNDFRGIQYNHRDEYKKAVESLSGKWVLTDPSVLAKLKDGAHCDLNQYLWIQNHLAWHTDEFDYYTVICAAKAG